MEHRALWCLAVAVLLAGSCGGSGSRNTSSPSPVTGSADTTPFRIDLPIAPGDSASSAYALWPFGVHGGGHAADGHPGFDFEYRIGAPVLAAADGIVDSNLVDTRDASKRNVQLRHHRSIGDYLTNYTNLEAVPANLSPGVAVSRGQTLGVAGPFAGGVSAMIHFQMADPALAGNPTVITSPEAFVSDAARAQLDAIWRTAAYRNEWCEPLMTNRRENGFPMRRTWVLRTGDGPASIAIECASDAADPTYTSRRADGSTETGTLALGWAARPTTVDFRAQDGSIRLGTYDIVGPEMALAIAAPGMARPPQASTGSIYRTE